MEDIILYDPEVNTLSTDSGYVQYIKEGNHVAKIVDVEVLEPKENQHGEEYQQIQLQWQSKFGSELRQQLTFQHEGATKKDEEANRRARGALNITAGHMHDLGICFDHEGLVGLNDIKTKFANSWVAIAVRQGNGKYREVKQIRKTIDQLDKYTEPATSAYEETDQGFAERLKNLIPKG